MNPRAAFILTIVGMIFLIAVLCLLFPAVFEFVKAFTGELRFVWWIILLLALGLWLMFGVGKAKK
jgi:hypothetical protein